jgi:hypothetical protein
MDALKQKLIESGERMFQSFLLQQSLKKNPVAHKKNYEHQRWMKTKERLETDPVFAAEYRAMQKAAQAKHLAKKPRPPRRIELQDRPEQYAKYLADRRRRYAERCARDPNYRADCAKKNREAKARRKALKAAAEQMAVQSATCMQQESLFSTQAV